VVVSFPDGNSVTLRQPYYHFYDSYAALPPDLLRSGRNAPPLIGLGLLEAIRDEDILAGEDPADADGDYLSGIANRVWNIAGGHTSVGRFGWKAGNPGVLHQTADAFLEDLGITTEGLLPFEACSGQPNCAGMTETPDLSRDHAEVTAFYLKSLGVPAPRNLEDPQVALGKQLFSEISCAGCHRPEWKTGPSPYPFLSGQTIFPYTDMLLHDMGEGLGDGRPEFLAGANEWRTPPLWGIGLSGLIHPEGTFLHDGRAVTMEEAILWHGGEAIHSRNAYMQLPAASREALIRFLEAL
jgi:CxxC motif-containing protein (DUF1111 family)